MGVGYIISDLVKNNEEYKELKIREPLPTTDIVLVYNKKFLTKAPMKFIEDYIKYEIK